MLKDSQNFVKYVLLVISIITVSYSSASINGIERSRRSIKYFSKKTVDSIKNEPEFIITDTPDSIPSRRSNDVLLTNNVTVTLGHNALLPCAVRNIGSFKILWLRVKDGDVLAYDNMLITQDHRFNLIQNSMSESNLFIKNVRLSDAGEYACQLNTEVSKTKFIDLIIQTAPEFADSDNKDESSQNALAKAISANGYNNGYRSSHGYSNTQSDSSLKAINIMEGSQIVLECNAIGVPKPTINWYVKKYHNDHLIKYKLNSSKITVKNVTRDQFEYFECEANNDVPPSISKKFKINVLYMPEVHVSPNKVFIASPPTQVKINCSVNSYPASDIIWIYRNKRNFQDKRLKRWHRRQHKNRTHNLRHTRAELNHVVYEESEAFVLENNLILNSELKYSIYLQSVNETFKQSSIIIDIESERDYGVYACFANNSAGSKSQKFYIYGDHARKHHKSQKELSSDLLTKKEIKNNKHYNSQSTFKERIYPYRETSPLASTPKSIDIHEKINKKLKSRMNQATTLFENVLGSKSSALRMTGSDFSRNRIYILLYILSIFYLLTNDLI